MTLWIVLGIAALLVVWLISAYNGLVRLRNMAQEAWSGIDVQLKRRCDLVPNLVETVKGYASHEKSTLDEVTKARTSVINSGEDAEARLRAENMLSSTLRSLFAVAEAYPDLKANTNFIQLQEQLSRLEDEIQMARRYYNGSARNLNNAVQQFPGMLIAGPMGFSTMPYFEADDSERSTPKVAF
ncbi:MAG: LemA family protein [Synergistaceae bacterium]|nr:LemA family protein [Synergistaceae bacterium]